MNFLNIKPNHKVDLPAIGDAPDQVHVFGEDSIGAVNAAIAARRPLLVRGESGTGKTQLARAAAKALGWAFIPTTIDARSETSELLYDIDSVTRLAEAQVLSVLDEKLKESDVRDRLAEHRYIHPGPLWWAFNWPSAQKQAQEIGIASPPQPDGGDYQKGTVLLIDEIDKADIDLPNGLLEAFGSGQFQPRGLHKPVTRNNNPMLVIITTNEERSLPDAFLRRCLVLHLQFKKGDAFVEELVERAVSHFPALSDTVRKDRDAWLQRNLAAPGLAEYLDLLRAVTELADSEKAQLKLLTDLAQFVVKKHPEEIW